MSRNAAASGRPQIKREENGIDFAKPICGRPESMGNQKDLLLDFAKERLIFQRVIYNEPPITAFPQPDLPELLSNPPLARSILGLIKEIYLTHGLGYRDTTYRGLL